MYIYIIVIYIYRYLLMFCIKYCNNKIIMKKKNTYSYNIYDNNKNKHFVNNN